MSGISPANVPKSQDKRSMVYNLYSTFHKRSGKNGQERRIFSDKLFSTKKCDITKEKKGREFHPLKPSVSIAAILPAQESNAKHLINYRAPTAPAPPPAPQNYTPSPYTDRARPNTNSSRPTTPARKPVLHSYDHITRQTPS